MSDREALRRLAALRSAISVRKAASAPRRVDETRAQLCRFYQAGRCTRAHMCTFSHATPPLDRVSSKPTYNIAQQQPDEKVVVSRLQLLQRMLRARKGISSTYINRSPPASIVSSSYNRVAPQQELHNGSSARRYTRSTSTPFHQSASKGSLVRSALQSTRQSASSRLKRSLHQLRTKNSSKKLDKRAKQLCMFYCRFGVCKQGAACPFLHDAAKIAVCRDFIATGKCQSPGTCLLSHQIDKNKMPVCTHFLKGICTKGDSCMYRHVKVNPNAAVCQDFAKGYCAAGDQCRLQHVYLKRERAAGTPEENSQDEPPLRRARIDSDRNSADALQMRPSLPLPNWA